MPFGDEMDSGYPWIIHGYPWISMDFYGYPWIYMDILKYLELLGKKAKTLVCLVFLTVLAENTSFPAFFRIVRTWSTKTPITGFSSIIIEKPQLKNM